MSNVLVPDALFSIRVNNKIYKHPFVQKRVVPALEKTHTKQIALLKQKYKKRFANNSQIAASELDTWIWFGIINEMVSHYVTVKGKDRGLSFFLFSGGAYQHVVWDNLNKSFYPTNNFSFDLPFSNDPDVSLFEEDNQVSLRGKVATAYRDGQRYSVLKIYFYVGDTSEKRDPGSTSISKNVGILAEIPYFFIRSDRYDTFQDTDTTDQLLSLFELKKDDRDFSPPDFIPTDELGEMYHNTMSIDIGNDYVGVYVA